jgi:hypothetical protein
MMDKKHIHWGFAGSDKNPIYGGGISGGSEIADDLRNFLTSKLPESIKLNSVQRDHIFRILTDAMSFVMRDSVDREIIVKPRHQIRTLPNSIWPENSLLLRWDDHLERWTEKDSNRSSYVGHPYSLSTEDMHRLLEIERNGHNVQIDGRSHYGPGHTLRVKIT